MKRSTNVIVSNLSRDNILFSTFYTGLFLLFRKKNWGARAPPAPPLATALECKDEKKGGRSKHYAGIIDALNKSHNHI